MASRLTLHNLHKITVQVQSATALSVVFVYKDRVYKDRNAIPIILKIFRR